MSQVSAPEHTIDDLLARLERERLEADRLYNVALTAVDHAIQSVPTFPDAPADFDAVRLADLNVTWDILPGPPPAVDGSLKGRLRGLVWRIVGPPLEAQKRFNAALVDHLNRNVRMHQATGRAVAALLTTVKRELEALVRFESLLIQQLQTITAYVDTKDRSLGGAELRQRLALTEQRLLALKRETEPGSGPRKASAQAAVPFSGAVDSVTYVGFEDRFRGSREEIARRVDDYVPILAAATEVVDIGCGRGELLALLKAQGVSARGVDTNAAMVELCRSRGLQAEEGDAVSFLERQPDGTIGGVVAIQVVEHFTPAYLMRFLDAAFHTMRPGAPLILETINPSCWMAFFETYIRDPTHAQPIHPDTLRYLVQASGFSSVDVTFRAPVAEEDRLPVVEPPAGDEPGIEGLSAVAAAVNAHAERLNRLLFSFMDYVVVARR
jgi:O-antigen chain-terminating methyltransferase